MAVVMNSKLAGRPCILEASRFAYRVYAEPVDASYVKRIMTERFDMLSGSSDCRDHHGVAILLDSVQKGLQTCLLGWRLFSCSTASS